MPDFFVQEITDCSLLLTLEKDENGCPTEAENFTHILLHRIFEYAGQTVNTDWYRVIKKLTRTFA